VKRGDEPRRATDLEPCPHRGPSVLRNPLPHARNQLPRRNRLYEHGRASSVNATPSDVGLVSPGERYSDARQRSSRAQLFKRHEPVPIRQSEIEQ